MNYVFEFDQAKSHANLAKHGIDFIEAQDLWRDFNLTIIDADSRVEVRNGAIGKIRDKNWTAIFTSRNGLIRLISVRRSRLNEVKFYEQNIN
jgi:uncharacterized protein